MIKAKLEHVLIKTAIKPNFVVFYNKTFNIVSEVTATHAIIPDGTQILLEELEGKVVKFLAIIAGKTPYSIFNSDYDKIIDTLVDTKNGQSILDLYLAGNKITLSGNIIHKHTAASKGMSVKLTNIYHIDKYGLYDVTMRIGEIKDYKDYKYRLCLSNKTILCKREDFEIMVGEDKRHFFHIFCKECGN